MEKILTVVDMQYDFIDGALGTKEAVAILSAVCEKIKQHEGRIFVTQDTHYENYLETQEGKKLPIKHCLKMTKGWFIHEQVLKALEKTDYQFIEKPTFASLDLAEKIRSLHIDEDELEIELIGLCTDICVVSNALLLKANFPEAAIRVDAACCAGVTPESHKAALETMKMCQIEIIGDCDTIKMCTQGHT